MKKIILVFLLILKTTLYSQWVRQTEYVSSYNFGRAIDASSDNTAVFYGASGTGDGLYLTFDNGNSWNTRIITEHFISDVSIIEKDFIWYATLTGNVYYSSNKGVDWTKQISIGKYIPYIKMFDKYFGIMIPDGENESSDLTVYVTASSGVGWTKNTINNVGGYIKDWRQIDFINKIIGYYYDTFKNQKLYKTIDGGYNWNATNYTGSADLIKFYNENIGIAASINWDTNKIILQKTIDGGNNWNIINSDLEGTWISDLEFLPNNPNKIWFVINQGLFYSDNGGISWSKQNLNNETFTGRDLIFTSENNGWLLCDEGKIFYTSNNGGLTEINEKLFTPLPLSYTLLNNFPNPFNPTTIISYQLPENEFVSLKIYDLLGKEISSLVKSYQIAGDHKVEFDASDFSAGVYIYQIRAGRFNQSKKMILLK